MRLTNHDSFLPFHHAKNGHFVILTKMRFYSKSLRYLGKLAECGCSIEIYDDSNINLLMFIRDERDVTM